MRALEWNPAFGPIVMALIILGACLVFYVHWPPRLGAAARPLSCVATLLPKMVVVVCSIIARACSIPICA